MIKLEGNNIDRVLLELEHALRRLPPPPALPGRFLLTVVLLIVVIGAGVFFYTRSRQTPGVLPISGDDVAGNSATAVLNTDPTVQQDFEAGEAEGWLLNWGQPFTVIEDGTGNHVWRSAGAGEMFYVSSADWRDYAVELDY